MALPSLGPTEGTRKAVVDRDARTVVLDLAVTLALAVLGAVWSTWLLVPAAGWALLTAAQAALAARAHRRPPDDRRLH